MNAPAVLVKRAVKHVAGHSIWYRGRKRFCPCCGGSFRKFLPYGVKQRPEARCPGCGALERHRLLWLYLQSETSLFRENLRLLHLAPEPVFKANLSRLARLHYVTADLSPALGPSELADITALPHQDSSFDAILCSHVLEHVPDDRAAMRELYRVLRPGGWAILQTPIDLASEITYEDWKITAPDERERAFGQHDHVRVYGLDYETRLAAVGFDVSPDNFVSQLGARTQRMGLSPNQHVWMCRKPLVEPPEDPQA